MGKEGPQRAALGLVRGELQPEFQEHAVGRSLWLQDGELERKPRRMHSNLKTLANSEGGRQGSLVFGGSYGDRQCRSLLKSRASPT